MNMMKKDNKFFFSQTSLNVSIGIVQMVSTSTIVGVKLVSQVSNAIQVWNPCILLIKHLIYLLHSVKWVNILFVGEVLIPDTIILFKKEEVLVQMLSWRVKINKKQIRYYKQRKIKDYPAHLGQTRVTFIIYVRIIFICYNLYMIQENKIHYLFIKYQNWILLFFILYHMVIMYCQLILIAY